MKRFPVCFVSIYIAINSAIEKGEVMMKRFLSYLSWTLVIGIVLYYGMQLQEQIIEQSTMTFNPFPRQAYIALFPVVIGLLINAPKVLLHMKNKTDWTYDWIKFAAIGLPTLYLVVMTFLPFSPLGAGRVTLPMHVFFSETTVTTIAGLVFGYIVLASFRFGDTKANH